MHFVACAAGASLFLVDVEVVEVEVAIAELGEAHAFLCLDEIGDVALEAELVALGIERSVELGRVFIGEQAEVVGAVGAMASGALPLADWAVMVWIVGEEFCHVGQCLARVVFGGLVVAIQADIWLWRLLEFGKSGLVRRVASAAAVFFL